MKKLVIMVCLFLVSYMQGNALARTNKKNTQVTHKMLITDKVLLPQYFSYSTPDMINGPTGTLTVTGDSLSNDTQQVKLEVTLTILWGAPITVTLNYGPSLFILKQR